MTTQNTKLVTLGRDHQGFGSVNPPVYRASTIVFNDFEAFSDAYYGRVAPWYGRQGNPTSFALRDALNALIDADCTVLTPSGLLAISSALMACVKAGDHLLMVDSVYGSTRTFCDNVLSRMGVEITYYPAETSPEALRVLLKPNTSVLFLEAPGSLTFEMQDVRGLCAVAHAHGCVTMLDYTWATPLYIKPFALGVDIAIQAVTKYVSGHSDIVMGAASCKEPHAKVLAKTAYQMGNYVGGDEAYLALRGLRTMELRLREQQANTWPVLAFLETQPEIAEILYPPHPSDRGHALWKAHCSGGAALFGIVMRRGTTRTQVAAFTNALHHFGMGFSWGGYESLVVPFQPAEIRTRAAERWQKDDWCVRFHIGLESPDDLIADLKQGFAALRAV
jgi:cystathionine beta-lyase